MVANASSVLVTSIILVILTGIFNTIVLTNVGNLFPVIGNNSYLDSPYWMGIQRPSTTLLMVFQLIALIGFGVWLADMTMSPPTEGVLQSSSWRLAAVCMFLIPFALWPFATYHALEHPKSLAATLVSCSCLWIAAIGVALMIVGTFENTSTHPRSLLGVLFLGMVVILVDAMGWCALAIRKTTT